MRLLSLETLADSAAVLLCCSALSGRVRSLRCTPHLHKEGEGKGRERGKWGREEGREKGGGEEGRGKE